MWENANSSIQESDDYAEFKARIKAKSGIDLSLYKQNQMHRRLLSLVERANTDSFCAYFKLLERDPQEYATFLDRMTINVSELFRNPEKWQELRERLLLPFLAKKRTLKIWSAGCSYGAEPYTLALLLDQLSPGKQHTLHATDLDRNILAKAKAGCFTGADVKNVPADMRARYFMPLTPASQVPELSDIVPTYQVKPEIRARVAFRAHNLLADPFESDYDLICCRNVVIYFTDEAKDRLFARFSQALAPGGYLFVGGTERIFQFRELGFDSPLPFFYRKL